MKSKVVVVVGAAVAAAVTVGVVSAAGSTPRHPDNSTNGVQQAPLLSAPAPGTAEHLYTPLPGCKIIDTKAAGGAIPAGGHRSFFVRGTTGFGAQGGHSGGCGVPSWATAISYELHEVSSTGAGYSHVYSFGASAPGVRTETYSKSPARDLGSNIRLSAPGSTRDLVIDANGHSVQAIVVVTGFYAPEIHAVIGASGGIFSGTSRVLSAVRTGVGRYTVTIDRDLTGCTPIATMHGSTFYASAFESGNTVKAETWALSGGTPTDTDLFWSLDVLC